MGTHIDRIKDFDEVTNHFLQVFIAHCVRKKGVLKEKDLVRMENTDMTGPKDSKSIILA